MSKPRVVPDIERTAKMLDLVRESYPRVATGISHVVIEEVAPGTGWYRGNRWADVLVLSVWPSKGLTLHGYEIKASRADLKRELADPKKHSALARYCDHWTLVAWDESVLVDGIPAEWGIQITAGDDDGDRWLKVKRKAAVLKPEPRPWHLTCSLVRNAYEQSPGVAYVARVVAAASRRGYDDGESSAEGKTQQLLDPIAKLLYGGSRWEWPDEARDPERLCKVILDRLSQGVLGAIT